MTVNGKKIASFIEKQVKKEIKKLKTKPKLVVFLIGQSDDQLSFVKIKEKVAKRLGISFELIHKKRVPLFEPFVRQIKKIAEDEKTTGIIIQQPLPSTLSTETIYQYIPKVKEIEGHQPKSPYLPPIGLAVLTVLKYILLGKKIDKKIIIHPQEDINFFYERLKNKKIVLVGQGITGGIPIGKTLNHFKLNYIAINSKTSHKERYYQQADIIITAVGKKVLSASDLKKGAILINVGLRKENGKLKGDYDEKEIKKIASYYTPTPNGIGPIDIAYLYKNLVDAAKNQLITSNT